ncbi:basic proline-rich protein-like [Bos javanicus]|uniref:basic proline-rich protein-like n=1 Tax=Bos javanicus TaxID=9906 RepID=UPI002AA81039|nr:basic proline-rich protein-like [Bos javanicus]
MERRGWGRGLRSFACSANSRSARGPVPTWKPAPQPPRHAHPGGPAAGPPAGAFLGAAWPAPRPPPARPAPSGGSGRPPGDLGSVAKVLAFPGALPTPRPRPPAEPVPSPGSTLGSVSKVRMQLPPTLVGLAPSFLHPGVPARFPGAPEPSQQMAARSGTSGVVRSWQIES